MERSNEYDNQTMQNENHIIRINDEIEIDQVMEKKENPSLQTEISKVSRFMWRNLMKKKLNTFWNNCKFKKNGVFIIKMPYVGSLLC